MPFMQSMALGAVIKVGVGNSVAALRSVSAAFTSTTKASAALSQKLGSVAMAMGAIGAAGGVLTAAIGVMGEKAASFEQQMSAVGAVMLKPRSEISELEKTAKRLGASTVFSATQVGEGMELMARAGFNVVDIIGPNGEGGGIEGVLNAAAASGDSLAETANHVSNVLKGMGLETSEASRVADVLALASSKTNSTIGSLGESIKNVASTARQFNIPLEQTVAGVALLQDVGLDASVAGSSMNTMLTKMATMSDETKGKLGKLGVAFEDVHGDMLPFPQVLDGIAKAAAESGGNMDAAGLLADLFGLRGQKAAANLKDMATSGRFAELTEQLMNAKGSAEAMAKLRLDNLKGQFTLMQSAVEGFSIEAMGPLNDQLKESVVNVTELIQAVTMGMAGEGEGAAADFGRGLKEGITGIADGLAWIRESIASITDSFSGGSTNWAKTAGIVTAAVVALIVVLTPVALAIAAIAAAGFLLGEALIPVLIGVAAVAAIGSAVLAAMFLTAEGHGMSFMELVGGLWLALTTMWESAKTAFMANWTVIEQAFAPGLEALKEAGASIMELFQREGPQTSASFADIGQTVGTVVAWVAQLVGWLFTGIAYLAKWGVAVSVKFVGPMMNAMDLILGGFLDLITGADTLSSSLGRIFFGISLMMTSQIRGAINSILEMYKIMVSNPASQAMFKLFGIDTDAAISGVQDFIADPPMPEWMEPQDKAAGLSTKLLELMQRTGADVATPPDPEVTVVNEDKRCIKIDNRLSVDGREAAIATASHHQDIKDRTGATSQPWQRRMILEHGATLLP